MWGVEQLHGREKVDEPLAGARKRRKSDESGEKTNRIYPQRLIHHERRCLAVSYRPRACLLLS